MLSAPNGWGSESRARRSRCSRDSYLSRLIFSSLPPQPKLVSDAELTRLSRLLSYYLRKYALDAALLPTLLRSLRAAVFPGNKFGATPPTLVAPANAQEEKALRRRTAEAVWAMAYGSRAASDATLADIDGVLDVFSDAYCNKHLLYGLLEAVLVRLMPEMAETGVLGLWEERLS